MTENIKNFYISIELKNGESVGHAFGSSLDGLKDFSGPSESLAEPPTEAIKNPQLTFQIVFSNFVSIMNTYKNFNNLILNLTRSISTSIAGQRIRAFASHKGKKLEISDDENEYYELSINNFREFSVHHEEAIATLEGSLHLPEVMIIGLVSVYDAFLSQLLRVIFLLHEGLILTSEKTIKFSDLSKFRSIEEARSALIDREIETVLRSSHHEQFAFMESRFNMKLRSGLTIWPDFIEICERRNLLTHTGGVVSAQYLENCEEHGCKTGGLKVGTTLNVDTNYYSKSVNVFYELGVKLCYVLWKKFSQQEKSLADTTLNELCFDLIFKRNYSVAESLLEFGIENIRTYKGSDSTRRRMIVNLANAIKLQNRPGEAKALLDKEDWSAVADSFRLCVAAVKGDIDAVVDCMNKLGASEFPAEHYRTWPVFRSIKSDGLFVRAFENIFNEPYILPGSVSPKNVEQSLPVSDRKDERRI